MTAKLVVLISSVFFWSFGILTVVSWHNQQDHQKEYKVDTKILRTINTTACKYCFVEIKD